MITLVREPEGTALCGQCCVATVAGVSLERAINAVGHASKSGTKTKDIIRGLRALDVQCAARLRRLKRGVLPPPRAILATYDNRTGEGHWVVTWDGLVLDPEDVYPNYDRWTITSYLEIYS